MDRSRKKLNNPSFFKLMVGDFSTKLRVPPAFQNNLKQKNLPMNFTISLRYAVGISWKVKVERRSSGFYYFTTGWREIVKDLQLVVHDFLVFYLVADDAFQLAVYDKTCCEKSQNFSTPATSDGNEIERSNDNVVVEEEEEDEDDDSDSNHEDEDDGGQEEEEEEENEDGEEVIVVEPDMPTSRKSQRKRSKDYVEVEEGEDDDEDDDSESNYEDEDDDSQEEEEDEDDDSESNYEDEDDDSQEQEEDEEEENEDGEEHIVIEPDMPTSRKNGCHGKVKQRNAEVKVTRKEVEKEVIGKKKSHFVKFTQPASTRSYCVLPVWFAKEIHQACNDDDEVLIKDPVGREWVVTIKYRASGNRCRRYEFTKGWKEFRNANKLAVGDTLEFKHIKSCTIAIKVFPREEVESHFVKFTQPASTRSYCVLPVWFAEEIHKACKDDEVLLKDPVGREWVVKIKRREAPNRRYDLTAGWPEFRDGNKFAVGDTLELKHIEGCTIAVEVLSK